MSFLEKRWPLMFCHSGHVRRQYCELQVQLPMVIVTLLLPSYQMYFFFLQVLRLFATLWVMTDSKCLYLHALAWPLAPKFVPFCVFSPWYLLYLRLLGYPLLSLVKEVFTCLIVFSSPFYLSFLRPFSSSYPRCFQKL